jgi:hypothetical protein
LAQYLFWRFHVGKQEWPDFSSSGYDKLLRGGGDPKTPLDESTLRKWIRDIFNEIGHKSSQTTHAGRKSGAQCAEITGVSEEEIRRAGRWNDLRNHRWTKLGVEFLAQHTQLVKSWLLPFYYLDLFRTVSTAIKLDIGKRNNVLTEPELLDL